MFCCFIVSVGEVIVIGCFCFGVVIGLVGYYVYVGGFDLVFIGDCLVDCSLSFYNMVW